ncbi:SGNH/GDSL hydrolase family protein [Lachnoclostridium sp.]|uniref:SGNH/GDSL hydrolase family protein n=1 Tax=Lachnoclostridium sp. TaxID=2028282 RepID=UPI002896D2DF|nr:SGNH/GDSL hydrolase family protein [Lachnoclostridium sp.]
MDRISMAERGVVSLGNLDRFHHVMERARKKEPLTIGFIGGSITQGSLSSTPFTCYAYRVFEWWKTYFQNENLTYVNAGIGATTSQFGVARVESDLLSNAPDVVFAEFSVNDEDNDLFMETYEGLIRTILSSKSSPALFLFHNVQYDTGNNAGRVHSRVGYHYQVPMVSIKDSIYEELQKGTLLIEEITPDNLHPNDYGHELVAYVITKELETIDNTETSKNGIIGTKLPKPITPNRFEGAIRYKNLEITPLLKGFLKDNDEQYGITDIFKGGYIASKLGDSIELKFDCKTLSVQYRKTIHKPAPIAKAVLDGKEEEAILLDANFNENWGDCLYLQDILVSDVKRIHTLTITIIVADKRHKSEFYLASVITS